MAAWQGVLDELLRDRRPALVAYASLLTGDRGAAEDLVHDAILRTFGRPRSLPNVNAADAYVRRAIASISIDRVRSRRRWLTAAPRLVAGPDQQLDDVPVRLDACAALRTLPRRQRTCVVLRFYDDLTVPEIAHQLGLSDGAVKRYLSDGIHHLNALLGTTAEVGDATSAPVYASGRRPR